MKGRAPGFRVTVTGDICPFGTLQDVLLKEDVAKIVAPVMPLFARSDLVIGNLEIPLCQKEEPIMKFGTSPHFMADPAVGAALKFMGFGALTLANNHIMDQGVQGLVGTMQALRANGIMSCGAGLTHAEACHPAVFSVNGRTLAVFNFAEGEFAQAKENGPGAARLEPFWSASRIADAREQYDFTIVILHLGNEYLPIPSDVTVSVCRAMAHAGADAVIAHHPHIPLCHEIYDGVPICYSLGNFLFGPREKPDAVLDRSPGWYLPVVAELIFSEAGCALELHPFKQLFDLSLEALTEQEETAFREYVDLGRAIIADPQRHQQIWDQEARNLFHGFHDRLKKYAQDIASDDFRTRRKAAAILHELFRTDAHHAVVQRGLRLVCEQRERDDAQAQVDLKELHRLLRASVATLQDP